MNNNYWDNPKNSLYTQDSQTQSAGLTQFFTQIYTWMALGLALTGVVASFMASDPHLWMALVENRLLFFGIILGQLALVTTFTALANRGASFAVLASVFIAYASLNGVTLSLVFLAYTFESVAQCFFVTAGSFGALSFYGYTTKRDLSVMGRFLFMGLVGLIIASIVGIFWQSSALHMGISLVGVLVFAGLTAYDTAVLKQLYDHHKNNASTLKTLSLQGALRLYLDFINLMLHLLRFMGRRK